MQIVLQVFENARTMQLCAKEGREMSSTTNSAGHECPFELPMHKCYEFGCISRSSIIEPGCLIKPQRASKLPSAKKGASYFVQVCAWCGKVLSMQKLNQPSNRALSHGICDMCRKRLMESRRKLN